MAFLFALLLGCSGLPLALVDLMRVIAAIAEPLLSCLACSVSGSSRISASQMDSQAWTSRDRPRPSGGGSGRLAEGKREFVRTEMGGSVMGEEAL